jgi:hypothetical protein
MADRYVDTLRQAIAAGEAVVVVGAGVSIGATTRDDGTPEPCASWEGLLRTGLARMRDHDVDQPLVGAVEALLDKELYENAAGLILKMLGPADVPAWLNDCFDNLPVRHRAVPEALGRLGVALLTTNYDHVLEEVTERGWRTWDEPEAWRAVLDHPTREILHVHGSYRRPDSVVLDDRSYDRAVGETTSQSFWRTIATTHSLVFVGLGGGFDDANFTQLRTFLATVLRGVGRRHYRLMPEEQIVPGTESELHENVKPVGFPGGLEGLGPFLESLAPRSSAAGVVPERPPPCVLEVSVAMDKVGAVERVGLTEVARVEHVRQLDPVDVETVQLLDAWLRENEPGALERGVDDRVLTRNRVQRQIGRILFDAVFGGPVGRLYHERRRNLAEPFSLVLLIASERLVLPDNESSVDLRDLPWEFLWEQRGYLSSVSNLPLVRVDTTRGAATWTPTERLKVLVALVQPMSLLQVSRAAWSSDRYDDAIRGIVAAIGPDNGVTTVTDMPEGELGSPLHWDDFVAVVRGEHEAAGGEPAKPFDVLHFIGHASGGDNGVEIAFPSPEGGIAWIGGAAFANALFDNLDDERKPTLVFLHLCGGPPTFPDPRGDRHLSRASFNLLAYRLLRLGIPVVVAMQYPMWPDAGEVFTRKFYADVAVTTVAGAVQGARYELFRRGFPLGPWPVLFMGGDDRPMLERAANGGPPPQRTAGPDRPSTGLTPLSRPGQASPRTGTGAQPLPRGGRDG